MVKKAYTEQEEQIARFAKALGHPARIAILKFLSTQSCCFFGDIHEVLPIASDRIAAFDRVEECRINSGNDFAPESEILYQCRELGVGKRTYRWFYV